MRHADTHRSISTSPLRRGAFSYPYNSARACHVCMYVCEPVCVRTHVLRAYVHVRMCVRTWSRVRMCVCAHTCMHVLSDHTHIHTKLSSTPCSW